jgi:hypothetical protein
MSKRKKYNSNNTHSDKEEQIVMFVVILLYVVSLICSFLMAGFYSYYKGELFQIYRLIIIGCAIPVVFMIGYRLKTGRWGKKS